MEPLTQSIWNGHSTFLQGRIEFKFNRFSFFNYHLFKPSILQTWTYCLITCLQSYKMHWNIPIMQIKKM